MTLSYLGWAATGVFVSSYFCADPSTLRRMQVIGAAMWIIYGVAILAWPVIVANVLVLLAAAWTGSRAARTAGSTAGGTDARPAIE